MPSSEYSPYVKPGGGYYKWSELSSGKDEPNPTAGRRLDLRSGEWSNNNPNYQAPPLFIEPGSTRSTQPAFGDRFSQTERPRDFSGIPTNDLIRYKDSPSSQENPMIKAQIIRAILDKPSSLPSVKSPEVQQGIRQNYKDAKRRQK